MIATVILVALLPFVKCAGEGNIRLLQDEVAEALKNCAVSDNSTPQVQRQKRCADNAPHIDDGKQETNLYGHERRNDTDMKNLSSVINVTESDYAYASNMGDKCLSQCVFANLQVVDSRGIPREAELWNKVQSSVSSQQSRAALKDQISACFLELQSEAEDNGCSYSNKLERCLMLRFSDRKSDQSNDKGRDTKSTT